jgi:hypothetical protein
LHCDLTRVHHVNLDGLQVFADRLYGLPAYDPSGIGQQLLFHSLERAVASLDSNRFSADQVAVDVFTLSDERTQTFVKEFLIAHSAHFSLR